MGRPQRESEKWWGYAGQMEKYVFLYTSSRYDLKMSDVIYQNISQRKCQIECKGIRRLQQTKYRKEGFSKIDKTLLQHQYQSISKFQYHRKCMNINVNSLWNDVNSIEIKWNHCLRCPTKSKNQKHCLRCPLKWSQKCPATKSKTCLEIIQDTQPSPTKNVLCQTSTC